MFAVDFLEKPVQSLIVDGDVVPLPCRDRDYSKAGIFPVTGSAYLVQLLGPLLHVRSNVAIENEKKNRIENLIRNIAYGDLRAKKMNNLKKRRFNKKNLPLEGHEEWHIHIPL